MALFNVDVTTVVQLGEDADGRLSVTAVQCLAKVGRVDVQLNGQFRCRQLVDGGETTQEGKEAGADCDADVSFLFLHSKAGCIGRQSSITWGTSGPK